MKKIWISIKCAIAVYRSEQYFVCTTKNGWFETDSEMKVATLKYIVEDTIDESIGEHSALKQAKELLNI